MDIKTLISKLPYELRYHIVYLGGLDLACCTGNKHLIKRLVSQITNYYDAEEIIYKHHPFTLKYLIFNKLWYLPRHSIFVSIDDVIILYNYNHNEELVLQKIQWIDNYYPRCKCTSDALNFSATNGMSKVVAWINKNRPVIFFNLRVKKLCGKSFPMLFAPCGCLKCGGDGVGY